MIFWKNIDRKCIIFINGYEMHPVLQNDPCIYCGKFQQYTKLILKCYCSITLQKCWTKSSEVNSILPSCSSNATWKWLTRQYKVLNQGSWCILCPHCTSVTLHRLSVVLPKPKPGDLLQTVICSALNKGNPILRVSVLKHHHLPSLRWNNKCNANLLKC